MSAMAIAPTVHPAVRAGTARTAAGRTAARRAAAGPTVEERGAAGPLRLTARGRAVVWVLGGMLAAGVGGAAVSAHADGPAGGTEVRRVVVAPGATLWGIATEVASPDEDVRDVVLQLMELNELPTGGLQAGQTIVVPAA